MEVIGFEPTAYCVQGSRSPTELHPRGFREYRREKAGCQAGNFGASGLRGSILSRTARVRPIDKLKVGKVFGLSPLNRRLCPHHFLAVNPLETSRPVW